MRILYCTTGLLRGGAEAQVVALAVRMKRRNHDVMVVSMTPITETWPALTEAGVPAVSLGMPRGRPTLRGWREFRTICRRFQPAVVHSHMVHSNLLGRSLKLALNAPGIVSTAHNVSEGGLFCVVGYRMTDWMADLTTNVSRAAVDAYVSGGLAPADRIIHMPNGIDLPEPARAGRTASRKRLGWSDDTFVWLAAGRLAPAKDYSNLLHAWAALCRQAEKPQHLFIAGDGPLRDQLRAEATKLRLDGTLTWLGLRSDVPDLIAAADGLVMSSAWEGLPMILLEASGAGIPAVATDVGGNREIVEHGGSGLLVPPKQSPALAAAMQRLMNLPAEERARWGSRGRQIVNDRYGFTGVLERWENIYRHVAAPSPGTVV